MSDIDDHEEYDENEPGPSRRRTRKRKVVDLKVSDKDIHVQQPSKGSATYIKAQGSVKDVFKECDISMKGNKVALSRGREVTTNLYGSTILNYFPPKKAKNDTDEASSSQETSYDPVYEGEEPPSISGSGSNVQNFIECFNQKTWKQTKFKVTENYKNLTEPDFEVCPQLRNITNFYGGEMAPNETEYKKEQEFAVEKSERNVGELVTPEQLVEWLGDKSCRYIALIGQAGSGKTTMMKRLPRSILVANNLVEQARVSEGLSTPLLEPQKRGFRFVLHLDFKDMVVSNAKNKEEALNLCDLLFRKNAPELSKQELEEGYRWIQQHQSKAIFFFDGLDQATWNLQGNYNKMTYYDKSSTATIMYNILTGNLFPDVTIVISSREHRIASLSIQLRPQFVTALAGLSLEDRKKLFIAVSGDSGKEAWKKLAAQSPAIIHFSAVPLILIFNAIVHKSNPENPPDTITEVMLQTLYIIMRSYHTKEWKHIKEILHKLMEMSFRGTGDKRVIFTHNDLTKTGLIEKQVRDMITRVPGHNMLRQRLMEGDYLMFFNHQIYQEMLSALYIANMDLPTFRSFLTEKISDDHWSVVLRMLCGIILNQKIEKKYVEDLAPGARRQEKQQCLRECVTAKRNYCMDSNKRLALYGALYEANDPELTRSVRVFAFRHEFFTTTEIYAMSSVMRRCGQLDLVSFAFCGLNAELLKCIEANLKGSNLKIDVFDVGWNEDLGTSGWADVGSVVTQCQVKALCAACCKLTPEAMEALKENTRNAQIDKLIVYDNENLGSVGWADVGSVVSQCQVKELYAGLCNLTPETMKAFKENTRNAKIDKLDIGRNNELGPSGWADIGSVVSQCQVKSLVADNCNLTPNTMNAFKENTLEAKIQYLDLSCNHVGELGDVGLSTISEIVHQCQIETLKMEYCYFNDGQLERFKAMISDTGVKFIQRETSLG